MSEFQFRILIGWLAIVGSTSSNSSYARWWFLVVAGIYMALAAVAAWKEDKE